MRRQAAFWFQAFSYRDYSRALGDWIGRGRPTSKRFKRFAEPMATTPAHVVNSLQFTVLCLYPVRHPCT